MSLIENLTEAQLHAGTRPPLPPADKHTQALESPTPDARSEGSGVLCWLSWGSLAPVERCAPEMSDGNDQDIVRADLIDHAVWESTREASSSVGYDAWPRVRARNDAVDGRIDLT
jgi:hypothetical protein